MLWCWPDNEFEKLMKLGIFIMRENVLFYEHQSTTSEHYNNHDFMSGALVLAI